MTHKTGGCDSQSRTTFPPKPMRKKQYVYVHQARCYRGASQRQRSCRRSRLRSSHRGAVAIHRSVSQARFASWPLPSMEGVNGSVLDQSRRSQVRPNANTRTMEGRRSGGNRAPPLGTIKKAPERRCLGAIGEQLKAINEFYHGQPLFSRG